MFLRDKTFYRTALVNIYDLMLIKLYTLTIQLMKIPTTNLTTHKLKLKYNVYSNIFINRFRRAEIKLKPVIGIR